MYLSVLFPWLASSQHRHSFLTLHALASTSEAQSICYAPGARAAVLARKRGAQDVARDLTATRKEGHGRIGDGMQGGQQTDSKLGGLRGADVKAG